MPSLQTNENGSVLLVALVMLLLVTFIGLSSLAYTSSELTISGNDRSYRQNFYRAESVVREAALLLEAESSASPYAPNLPWLSDGSHESAGFKPETQPWVTKGSNQNARFSSFYGDKEAAFCALRTRVAGGSNQDMSGQRKWEYVIYGRSTLASGNLRIAAGYLEKTN